MQSLEVVAGGGGGGGVLSCPLVVPALVVLPSDPHQGVQQYPEPARNRAKEPETGYSPKRPENSLYI